jgi:hypothetical protein
MKKNEKCADDKWSHIRGVAENSYFCSLGQEGWWGPGFLVQGMQNLFLGIMAIWGWSGDGTLEFHKEDHTLDGLAAATEQAELSLRTRESHQGCCNPRRPNW